MQRMLLLALAVYAPHLLEVVELVEARCVSDAGLVRMEAMSSLLTMSVRPSLQITKISPGSAEPLTISSSKSSATPTARPGASP